MPPEEDVIEAAGECCPPPLFTGENKCACGWFAPYPASVAEGGGVAVWWGWKGDIGWEGGLGEWRNACCCCA